MEEWVIHGPTLDTLPIWWYGGPMLWASDPFGITTSPNFQREAVAREGRAPDWEYQLSKYEIIDQAHLIRYTRMAKVLAWLGNDAIAKDDLRAQAEGIRLAYNMYRQNSWPQGVISTGMLNMRTYVDAHPGWGFPYGRADGWGLDTVCASLLARRPEWRRLVRPWFNLVIDLVRDGQIGLHGHHPGDVHGQHLQRPVPEPSVDRGGDHGARSRRHARVRVPRRRRHEASSRRTRS
jgi:hypothetical protein